MSYQVLARKWRPKSFADMVGQGHVVRALSNALDRGQLHHPYLFTGTRGVGKTTLARILSKALNCERGVSATPCGVCTACRSVDEGRFVDLLEVDAASRSKVDQTRELMDNVPFAPISGRYKVYLIDEVHMLSTGSFNALLKTLEEPPPHVKFLLATTDPQKVPVTVLSRCLQFTLKRLSPPEIQGQLAHILEVEGIAFDPQALALLARAADGSMRDGLSLLDQAIAFGGGRVQADEVEAMLGAVAPAAVVAAPDDGVVVFTTCPDAELRALADAGALSEPGVLRAQAERMLSDPRARAFAQHFPDRWLGLDQLGSMPPDPERLEVYYRTDLERSMRGESRAFFAHLLGWSVIVAVAVGMIAWHFGVPLDATLLWKTPVPCACSRPMPLSNPYSDTKSAGSCAATKLLRIPPSMCPM